MIVFTIPKYNKEDIARQIFNILNTNINEDEYIYTIYSDPILKITNTLIYKLQNIQHILLQVLHIPLEESIYNIDRSIKIFHYLQFNMQNDTLLEGKIRSYVTSVLQNYIENPDDYLDIFMLFAGDHLYEKFHQDIQYDLFFGDFKQSYNITTYKLTLENGFTMLTQTPTNVGQTIELNGELHKVVEVVEVAEESNTFVAEYCEIEVPEVFNKEEIISKFQKDINTAIAYLKQTYNIQTFAKLGIRQSDFTALQNQKVLINEDKKTNTAKIIFNGSRLHRNNTIHSLDEQDRKIQTQQTLNTKLESITSLF